MTGMHISRRFSKRALSPWWPIGEVEATGIVLRVEDSLRALQTIAGAGARDVGAASVVGGDGKRGEDDDEGRDRGDAGDGDENGEERRQPE